MSFQQSLTYKTDQELEAVISVMETCQITLPAAAIEVHAEMYKEYLNRINDSMETIMMVERNLMSDYNHMKSSVRTTQALYNVKLSELIQADTENKTHVMKKAFAEASLIEDTKELSELSTWRDKLKGLLSYAKLRRNEIKQRRGDINAMYRIYKDSKPYQVPPVQPEKKAPNPFSNVDYKFDDATENNIADGLD